MAGGARDRSRNPPAGFDRARRTAAGDAGLDSTGRSNCRRPPAGRSAAEAEDGAPRPPALRVAPPRAQCTRCESAGGAAAAADRGSSRSRPTAAAEAATATGADAAGGESAAADVLERFKRSGAGSRQENASNREFEFRFDSIETEKALGS